MQTVALIMTNKNNYIKKKTNNTVQLQAYIISTNNSKKNKRKRNK